MLPVQYQKIFHQILVFCPVLLSSVLNGINVGWLAPVLKHSQDQNYPITLLPDQCSWMASLQEPAKICGFIGTVLLIDLFGRRSIYLVGSLLNITAWLLVALTTSVDLLYVLRFITGITHGMAEVGNPIYIGENSLPQLRGIVTSCDIMFFLAGMVMEFVLATYLPYYTVATVNVAFALAYSASYVLCIETPQYLIAKGRHQKAAENYQWLFPPDRLDEFEKMKLSITSRAESPWRVKELLDTPAYYKSLTIIVILRVLSSISGFWTLVPFLSMTFASSSGTLSPNEFTILFGVNQFLSLVVSTLFVERFGRRTILLTATAGMCLAHLGSATLYYLHDNVAAILHFPWLIFATISAYSVIYSSGVAPLVNIVRAEMFPQKIKAMGSGCASLAGSAAIFATSISFLTVARIFGLFVNFLFFAVVCGCMFAFVYKWLPETRGKSLVEIQEMLGTSESSTTDDSKVEDCRVESGKIPAMLGESGNSCKADVKVENRAE